MTKKNKDLYLYVKPKSIQNIKILFLYFWTKRKSKNKFWLKKVNKLQNKTLKLLVLYWGKFKYSFKEVLNFLMKELYITSNKMLIKRYQEWEYFMYRFNHFVFKEYLTRSYNLKKRNVSAKKLKKHKKLIKKNIYLYLKEKLKYYFYIVYLYYNLNGFLIKKEFKNNLIIWKKIKLDRLSKIKNYIYLLPKRALGYFYSAFKLDNILCLLKGTPLDQEYVDKFIKNRFLTVLASDIKIIRGLIKIRLKVIKERIIGIIKVIIGWIKVIIGWIKVGIDYLSGLYRKYFYDDFYYRFLYVGGPLKNIKGVIILIILLSIVHFELIMIYKLCRILYFFRVINKKSILLKWFEQNPNIKTKPLPKYTLSRYSLEYYFWVVFTPVVQCSWAFIWSSILMHNIFFYQICGALYLFLGIEVNPQFYYLIGQWQLWLIASILFKSFSKKGGIDSWRHSPHHFFFVVEDLEDKGFDSWVKAAAVFWMCFVLSFWALDYYKSDTFFVRFAKEETYEERLSLNKYKNIQVELQYRFLIFVKKYTVKPLASRIGTWLYKAEDLSSRGFELKYKNFMDASGRGMTYHRQLHLSKLYHKHREDPDFWDIYGMDWDYLLEFQRIIPEHACVKRNYALERRMLTEHQIAKLERYIREGDIEGQIAKPARSHPKTAWIEKQRWENMQWTSYDSPLPERYSHGYDHYIQKDYYDPADDDLYLHPIDEMLRNQLPGSPGYRETGKGAFQYVYGDKYSDRVNALYHPVLNPDVDTIWYSRWDGRSHFDANQNALNYGDGDSGTFGYSSGDTSTSSFFSSYESFMINLNSDENLLNIMNIFLN